MINAALVAMEYNALLPAGDIPRLTEGYEGFFHLYDMKGDVEHAELHYIVRDHDRATFEARKKLMEHAVKVINEKYGRLPPVLHGSAYAEPLHRRLRFPRPV